MICYNYSYLHTDVLCTFLVTLNFGIDVKNVTILIHNSKNWPMKNLALKGSWRWNTSYLHILFLAPSM